MSGCGDRDICLPLTSALTFLSFLSCFGSDRSSHAGDAFSSILHVWCRMRSLVSRFPSVCALGCTTPVLGAALRPASMQSQALKTSYSELSGWLRRAVVGKHLPKQHLRGYSRGGGRLPEPPGRRSVPFPAAAEGGNVVSRSPGKADLAETAAARVCPQLSLASKLHVREIGACSRGICSGLCAITSAQLVITRCALRAGCGDAHEAGTALLAQLCSPQGFSALAALHLQTDSHPPPGRAKLSSSSEVSFLQNTCKCF